MLAVAAGSVTPQPHGILQCTHVHLAAAAVCMMSAAAYYAAVELRHMMSANTQVVEHYATCLALDVCACKRYIVLQAAHTDYRMYFSAASGHLPLSFQERCSLRPALLCVFIRSIAWQQQPTPQL